LGGEHSALLAGCNGATARRKQCKLWKTSGSANNPSEWWLFPEAGNVLEGITLPPELAGYMLDGLTLYVRRRGEPAERAPEELALSWVACDGACTRWFHAACVHVVPSGDDEWLCEECTGMQPDEECDVLPGEE
jgi:hypothetical protein